MEKFKGLVVIVVLLSFILSGCSVKEAGQTGEVKGAAGQENAEEDTETTESRKKDLDGDGEAHTTYEFVDVYGEQYEAELLPELPKCEYDYDRLTEENGFKYYLDEKGEKCSKTGIDVSEYQPEVDWEKVKESGVDFVMVRLGYRGYAEAGRLVEDPYFRSHIEGALAAGLETGVYFFSQAVTEEEALEEAAFVLERIKKYKVTYPVVFDTEEIKFDVARTDHLSGEQFTENCMVFCDKIKEAGYDTMIYANMKWLAFTLDMTRLTDYDIWYADYEPAPQNPYHIAMWQYTETGQVAGIDGNVDINLLF